MSGAAVIISGIFNLNISCLGRLELQFLSPQYWVNVGNCVTFFSFLGYFIYQKIFFLGKTTRLEFWGHLSVLQISLQS